jgi:DNA-binding response OmpR family regulator
MGHSVGGRRSWARRCSRHMNLKNVSTLLVDGDRFTRGLIAQMLHGFRMDTPCVCYTGAAAKSFLLKEAVDLCIMEAVLPDMGSQELITWIRRPDMGSVRFVPVIVLSGYTQYRIVAAARDAGANTVLKKPISPQLLFDRIMWVARVPRPFIDTGAYAGPDRRFKQQDPPDKIYRRADDPVETETSEAATATKLTASATNGISR